MSGFNTKIPMMSQDSNQAMLDLVQKVDFCLKKIHEMQDKVDNLPKFPSPGNSYARGEFATLPVYRNSTVERVGPL